MEKELCLFDEYFQGYWILKCPHCALCKHCSDIWYDYKNGPYMAMCEEKYSNSNELGKGCIHFEVDKDDECVCTLGELESKLQALREEMKNAKEVASKILGAPEFDEKFIEQFAKDLMIPSEYLEKVKVVCRIIKEL